MPTELSKLEALFQQFRGDKAPAERAWIDTAKLISQYTDKSTSVAAIQHDFAQGEISLIAKQFDSHGKRTMGSLLYGKLALDNYLEHLPPGPEKKLCSEISKILGDLYDAVKENREQLAPLLSKTEEWLTTYLANSSNKEQALELTKGMFTMFSCLKLKLSSVSSAVNLISGAKALVALAQTKTPQLMTEIEQQARILEPQVEEIKRARASHECSLADNFDERYLELLNKEGETTKLTALKDTAAQITVDMESLIAKKKEKAQLDDDIIQLQALLQAAHDNDTLTTGRKYFQELIIANEEGYNVLRNVHPEQTKKLEELRATIKNESGGLKNGALYIGSWLSSPVAAIARTVTPNAISNAVSNVVPDTNDSLAKRKLIEMISAALADMKEQLKTKDSGISSLESTLAKGNEKLQQQIKAATPDDLQHVVTISKMTMEMVSEYEKVRQPIEDMGARLKNIKQLDQIANDFIRINDNTLSKIRHWFSRLVTLFKIPSISDKIAEARALKQDLVEYQATYTEQFNEQLDQLDKKPDISSPVKAMVRAQISDVAHNPTAANETAIDHFKAIREGAKMLRDEALKLTNEAAQKPDEEVTQGISSPSGVS